MLDAGCWSERSGDPAQRGYSMLAAGLKSLSGLEGGRFDRKKKLNRSPQSSQRGRAATKQAINFRLIRFI